jgi:hypothetical protein
MKLYQLIIMVATLFVILISVGYICIQHGITNTQAFQITAKEHLGTDNFTITSYDGWLQAETPDGNKYPTDTDMDKAYTDFMVPKLGVMSVISLIAIAILIILYLKNFKPVADETIKKENQQ